MAIVVMALAGCVDPIVIGSTGDGVATVGTGDAGDAGDDVGDLGETGDSIGVGDVPDDDDDGDDDGDDDAGIGPGCDCGPVSGLVLLDDAGGLWRSSTEGTDLEFLGELGCEDRFGPRPGPIAVAAGSNGDGYVLYGDDALFRVSLDDPKYCELTQASDELLGVGGHAPGTTVTLPRSDMAHVDVARFDGCGILNSVRESDDGVVFLDRWIPGTGEQVVVAAFPATDARLSAATDARLFAWLLSEDDTGPVVEVLEISSEGGDVLSAVEVPGVAGLWAPQNSFAVVRGDEGEDLLLIFAPNGDGSSTVFRATLPQSDGEQPQVELVTDDLAVDVRGVSATPC